MKILFRVDCGNDIGFGHLNRSLAIAKLLSDNYKEVEIIFLTSDNEISNSIINENKFKYIFNNKCSEEESIIKVVNKNNFDAIFIDKLFPYQSSFIKELQKYTKVCMFHNYCDGAFNCNQFIFPASHINDKILKDYRWKKGKVELYEGFRYVVLSNKVLELNKKLIIKTDPMKIIITTGASDPNGVMITILEYLSNFSSEKINIVALIGESFSKKEKLEKYKDQKNKSFSIRNFNYSDFSTADLAVNTFGVSTYELIYLGIPVITIGHKKENALGSALFEKKYGLTRDLGLIESLSRKKFISTLSDMIKEPSALQKINNKTINTIDGLGARRVARLIYNLGVS